MGIGSLFDEYATPPAETRTTRSASRVAQRTTTAYAPGASTEQVSAVAPPTQPHPISTEPIPWYATDLTRLDLPEAASDADLQVDGKAYRRLDPAYYVWMRRQMDVAQTRYTRGLLPEPHYTPLKDRFNAMHDLAIRLFGEAALLTAMGQCTPATYEPPVLRVSRDLSILLDDAVHAQAASQTVTSAAMERDDRPRIRNRAGDWQGWITRQYPADAWFPNGWADIILDDGTTGQADLRSLCDAQGTPLVTEPQYTAYELRAMELATHERPEDFDDLEASLPILSFPVPGEWPFAESPAVDDYLQVNDIREQAHAMGWCDADLFQTCGRYKFPYGQDYGLVCFLRGRTIGAVTATAIELQPTKPGGAPLTFARPQRARPEA